MIWLAWRQFRTQALVVAGLLVVFATALAINGSHLVHLYDTTVATCAQRNDCVSARARFQAQAKWHNALDLLVLAVPALLGAFWGAPLVARELETRTNLLAWTQSVTRPRWFLVKVAVTGAASVITAGLLSLMVTWWASPHDRLTDAPYSVFDQRDIVPMAYALFAVALGVVLGTIIRRTVPAMAATLAAFAVIRIGFGSWIRPRILSPLHSTGVFTLPVSNSVVFIAPSGVGPRDWLLSETVVTSTGRVVGSYDLGPNGAVVGISNAFHGAGNLNGVLKCGNSFSPLGQAPTAQVQAAVQRCVSSFHLHTIATYLPSSRYWALQGSESAIFVGGAIALLAVGLWWTRKRIA
jgi:hypothetical protein